MLRRGRYSPAAKVGGSRGGRDSGRCRTPPSSTDSVGGEEDVFELNGFSGSTSPDGQMDALVRDDATGRRLIIHWLFPVDNIDTCFGLMIEP